MHSLISIIDQSNVIIARHNTVAVVATANTINAVDDIAGTIKQYATIIIADVRKRPNVIGIEMIAWITFQMKATDQKVFLFFEAFVICAFIISSPTYCLAHSNGVPNSLQICSSVLPAAVPSRKCSRKSATISSFSFLGKDSR